MTVSVRSKILDFSVIFLIILTTACGLFTLRQPGVGSVVLLGGKPLHIEVAKTPAQQQLGLGGRSLLARGHGMLFVFDSDAQPCFWMKDMKFGLDMIWLDSSKKIVSIKENATPDSYPGSFCPGSDSRYVLELNAGDARRLDLRKESVASFNL